RSLLPSLFNWRFTLNDALYRGEPLTFVRTQAPPPVLSPTPVATQKPLLALAVSSEDLFANGRAKARINVFLLNTRLSQAVNVRLSVDRGKLEPERLVIPSGSDDAEALLSSTQPGRV